MKLTSVLRTACCLGALLFTGVPALAFDELTPAQQLIYDEPHLANTTAGEEIRYSYASELPDSDSLSDSVVLSVTGIVEKQRRDVSIDFLTDERHVDLPAFPGYRGNPVIIAMLEHVARSLGEQTGGGTLYFRNRIRDSLAQRTIEVDSRPVSVGQQTIDASVIEFHPFEGDAYLSRWPAIESSTFRISLSDAVPGGVVSIEAATQQGGEQAFDKSLLIEMPN